MSKVCLRNYARWGTGLIHRGSAWIISNGHLFPKIHKGKEWNRDKKDISVSGQNVLGNNDFLFYLRSVVFNEISHGTRDFVDSLAKLDFCRNVVFQQPAKSQAKI